MSLFRDVITNLFASVRGFRGALQTVLLSNGFWQGRQWRMYREFNLAQNAQTTIRLTAGKPFLLQGQSLYVDGGAIRAVIVTAPATSPGPWASMPTIFGKYLLAGAGTSAFVVDVSTTTGAITGGNEREVLRATGGAGNNNSTGVDIFGWRALPAGTYYIQLTGTGSTNTGIYAIEVEELD